MWWSVTCHVGTLPIGILGPEVFGLSLNQSVAAIVAGTILGSLCTGSTGTLGPKVRAPRYLFCLSKRLTKPSSVCVQS